MTVTYYMSPGSSNVDIPTPKAPSPEGKGDSGVSNHDSQSQKTVAEMGFSESILAGGSIAPKLENATAKYALPPCPLPPNTSKITNLPCANTERNSAAQHGSSFTP